MKRTEAFKCGKCGKRTKSRRGLVQHKYACDGNITGGGRHCNRAESTANFVPSEEPAEEGTAVTRNEQ